MNPDQPPAQVPSGNSGPHQPPQPPPQQPWGQGVQGQGVQGQRQGVPMHGNPGPQPAASERAPDSSSAVRIILHILCPLLIIAGISAPLDRAGSIMWTSEPTWAALATVAALVQIAAAFPPHLLGGRGWTVGASAAGVLLLTWTLIFLPGVASNRGFMVTLGVAAAASAVWLSPDRKQLG